MATTSLAAIERATVRGFDAPCDAWAGGDSAIKEGVSATSARRRRAQSATVTGGLSQDLLAPSSVSPRTFIETLSGRTGIGQAT